ncbi:MAG: peptide chain release factor N(5)-glutamine methyltransferase [Chloroflexi bacterium]|nr:peptide chain release factor N(5)-glutamine methyltransferase [Chloroflexota bacterium]
MSSHAERTIGESLRQATGALALSGSETPRLDAELLLSAALGTERPQWVVRWGERLEAPAAQRFEELLRRRIAHEPMAYLLGRRAFYDIELTVDARVLIPRPETELLVDEALAWAVARGSRPLRVVDVGTGSGALAIVLARRLPQARILATDLSWEALQVARTNVARYGLAERVSLLQGDLLAPLAGPVDLILANLPYVPRERLASLPRDVADYEPRLALDGGAEGLEAIRRLLTQAPALLAIPGLLLLEVDDAHAATVAADAAAAFSQAGVSDARVSVLYDYAGLERVVRITRG